MKEGDLSSLRRRLGLLRQEQSSAPNRKPADNTLPGEAVETAAGAAYRIEKIYPLDERQGSRALGDFASFPPQLMAEVAQTPALHDLPPEKLLFLDTETTGLAGGAGTLVFLVGIGAYVDGGFRLRQYFLREPAEEPAMLKALETDLEAAQGFVTFNGRVFDIPLLQSRYVLALRRPYPLLGWPHLDLLFPARRLWRNVLPNCTLGMLEKEILGLQRRGDDVPGAEIPGIYLDYLRTGETGQILRVLYHNAVDVLSLAALGAEVLARHQEAELDTLNEAEARAIARWHQNAGRDAQALLAYEHALQGSDSPQRLETIKRYTAYLKSQGRHAQALAGWQTWSELDPADPNPCIELSMYFEWREKDPAAAREWCQQALTSLTHWRPGWRRDQAWEEITHRLTRLTRKLTNESEDETGH